MATVGLTFGSATGGTGFDVASTVTSILAISQAIETPWNTQLTALKAQDTVLSTIGTDLSTLSTAVSALTNFDGVFAAKQGSSSNTNVLTLTAASTEAIAGSHTVTVTSLASTSSVYSDELTNSTDTLSGTLTLQVGPASATNPPQTITLDSSNNTLRSLAVAINNGSYGVVASVVTDTQGSRLSLVSSTSGAAGQITIGGSITDATGRPNSAASSSAVGFSVGQTGQDAVLNVDGLPTSSASNTVTGAIPGVTFQLLSSPPDTPVQIQVTNDNSSIETAGQTLVTAYNAVLKDIKTQAGNDAAGNPEPLYGDPSMSLLQSSLSTALFSGSASGSISNIEQLGFSVNPDGTLALDSTAMDAALNSNFSDIAGFFQNTGSFGQTLTTTLNQVGNASTTGVIAAAQAQNTAEEATLNTNVTNENALLATQKANLTTELNTANQILQSIPQQLSEQTTIYDAVTGYKGGN